MQLGKRVGIQYQAASSRLGAPQADRQSPPALPTVVRALNGSAVGSRLAATSADPLTTPDDAKALADLAGVAGLESRPSLSGLGQEGGRPRRGQCRRVGIPAFVERPRTGR